MNRGAISVWGANYKAPGKGTHPRLRALPAGAARGGAGRSAALQRPLLLLLPKRHTSALSLPAPTAGELNTESQTPRPKFCALHVTHAHISHKERNCGKSTKLQKASLKENSTKKYKPTTQLLFSEKGASSKSSQNVKTYNEERSELYFHLFT